MADDIAVMIVQTWDEEEIVALYKAGGWWKEEYKTEDLRYLIQGSFAFAVATETKTGRAISTGCVGLARRSLKPWSTGACSRVSAGLGLSLSRILKNFISRWDSTPWKDTSRFFSGVSPDALAG